MKFLKIAVLTSFLLLVMFCYGERLLAQQIKRVAPVSKSVFVFQSIHPGGSGKDVVVEVRGHPGKDEIGQRIDGLEIVLLSVQKSRRSVLSKTHLKDVLFRFDASLYRHRKSGDYLLAIEANGGQHDHTQVYYIDPINFHVRPLFEEIGTIYGDVDHLPEGRIIEHCPEQYIDPEEKPRGFIRGNSYNSIYLQRTWTYQSRRHRFVESNYRREE